MKMIHRSITALMTVALAATLFAHGGEEHITGVVKVITADSVTVENAKHEMVTVLFTPKMEVTKSKVDAKITDLKVGDKVVLHCVKNKDGKYEAHEVAWGAAPATTTATH
jgi:hypothetical protein